MKRWLSVTTLVCLLAAPAAAQMLSGPGRVVGAEFRHTAQEGESLAVLAARFGVERAALAAGNGLEPGAALLPGQVLRVDNRFIVPQTMEEGILINIPQRRLFVFRGGELQAHYPIAAGAASNPTPLGEFEIDILLRDPWWIVPPSARAQMERDGKPVVARVPPGPGNPLAGYWIGINRLGYGIHGTNQPRSVFGFRSLGCVRLHPEHVAELFEQVEPGMAVRIIYQPVMLGRAADGALLLEVHRDIYGLSAPGALPALHLQVAAAGLEWRVDWRRAQQALEHADGVPRQVGRPLGRLNGLFAAAAF